MWSSWKDLDVSLKEIASALSSILERAVRADAVPRRSWVSFFRSWGMGESDLPHAHAFEKARQNVVKGTRGYR